MTHWCVPVCREKFSALLSRFGVKGKLLARREENFHFLLEFSSAWFAEQCLDGMEDEECLLIVKEEIRGRKIFPVVE